MCVGKEREADTDEHSQELPENKVEGGITWCFLTLWSPEVSWVISIFHVMEPSNQDKEQGRDQVWRGDICVLAIDFSRQKAES